LLKQPGPGGLIYLRSPAFIGVRIDVLVQIADINGIRRTMILTSEKQKVGGSVLSLLVHRSWRVAVVVCSCITGGALVI
jgi:hypothetical protein